MQMYSVQARTSLRYVLRPAFGTDLIQELRQFVHQEDINLAWLSGVGDVSRANLRYYNQEEKVWIDIDLDKHLQVVSLTGNVSLLNGGPTVHMHIALADEEGRCYGGHVGPNTIVFNMEILLTALNGPPVMRKLDSDTGLTLWA
jgi:predicted DNA-binding protein with PD1-like motif